jgi:hypothetical protein
MFKSSAQKELDASLLSLTSPYIQVARGDMPREFFDEVLADRKLGIRREVANVRNTDGEKAVGKSRKYVASFAFGYVGQHMSRFAYDEFMKVIDSLLS